MATLSASPNVAARPVGHLVLKGKTQALEVWEPQAAQCAGCTPMDAFLQAYRAMEALDPAAVESFQELANAYPNDPLVALHLQRLRQGESGVQMVMLEK
jgi:adenylate cyclase